MTLKIGTLCYIGHAVACPGCAALAGCVVEIVGGPFQRAGRDDVYEFAPSLLCTSGGVVSAARRANLIPICEPPTADLTDRERERVA